VVPFFYVSEARFMLAPMEHTTDEIIDLLKKILPSAKPLVEPMAGAFLVALVRPLD
jgi:hypothetical protein